MDDLLITPCSIRNDSGQILPGRPFSSVPSEEEWEAIREPFTFLYWTKNKILKDVMAIMKQKLWIPCKTYKIRIQKWGLRKNLTRRDVVPILREGNTSIALFDDAAIRVRGRAVDPVRLERYRRRNRLLFSSSNACRSSRIGSGIQPQSFEFPSPGRIITPTGLRPPEKFMYEIDTYIKGSFDSGIWRNGGGTLLINGSAAVDRRSLIEFDRHFFHGCEYHRTGQTILAFACWRKGFVLIESLLNTDLPETIIRLMARLHRFGVGHPAVANSLRRHIANAANIYLKPGHKNLPIFTTLESVDVAELGELSLNVNRRFVDLFEQYLGLRHMVTFNMRLSWGISSIELKPWLNMKDCLPDPETMDQNLLNADVYDVELHSTRIFILIQRGDYHKVEAAIKEALERTPLLIDNKPAFYLYYTGRFLYDLGYAQYHEGQYDHCIINILQSIRYLDDLRALDEQFPTLDTSAMSSYEILEDVAVKQGRIDDSLKYRAMRRQLFHRIKDADVDRLPATTFS